MTLHERAAALASDAREAAYGQAVVVIDGEDDVVHLDPGADPLTESTRFDIGSVTKTFTALLLAEMVVRGDVALEDRAARDISYVQLATHTSGLPRLPENLLPKAEQTPDDPYRDYTAEDLAAAVDASEPVPGRWEYSNFGFMVLAEALAAVAGMAYPELLRARVLEPLGLPTTAVGWIGDGPRVPGYVANRPVPDWTQQVAGDGGIVSTIAELRTYLRAQLAPDATPLADAIRLTHAPHGSAELPLSWQRQESALWHNGSAGGFGAFCAFDASAQRAVGMLTNRPYVSALAAAASRALEDDA